LRAEEWTTVINDRPGNLFKLITAVGFSATAVIVSGRRAAGRESDVGQGSKTVLLVRRFIYGWQLARSRIDTKTGLLNVSTWESEAEVEINRAVRTSSPLAIALIDIDHFKAVNDTHGHLAGDKAIRAVTDALRTQLRSYDLAGRFGGEEFVILLPHTREVDAINLAERCRSHIAAMSISVGDNAESGPCIKLTVSVGVTALDGASRDLTEMLADADSALYYAKETGRNKTHALLGAVSGRHTVNQGSDAGTGSKTVLSVRQLRYGLPLAPSRIATKTGRVVRGFMYG
jgi:diguanylate cyclase (GGDEF)-like protein